MLRWYWSNYWTIYKYENYWESVMMTWCIIWSCYSIFQRLFLFLQFKIIWATLMKFSSYDSEYVWVKNELIKKEPGSYDKKICKNLWVNKSLINNLKRSKMQKSNSCMIRHSSKQHFKFISTPSSCIFKFSSIHDLGDVNSFKLDTLWDRMEVSLVWRWK